MKWILISIAATAAVALAGAEFNATAISPNLYIVKDDVKSPMAPSWITIANFDVTRGDQCPSSFVKVKLNGKDMCRSSYGCYSVIYKVHGVLYNEIIGMVRGYQKGTTEAFQASHHGNGINQAYVDGVSITTGYPRKHVWTYATGLTQEGNYPDFNCPCAVTPGPSAPSFVGDHYYCSSGAIKEADREIYYGPLWQGTECINDNCCAKIGLPWFYRRLPIVQHDDIEVRICSNQDFFDEAIVIDKLILGVRYNE